jgi:hypothetical protein
MVKGISPAPAPVLVLCSNDSLREALTELLVADGRHVVAGAPPASSPQPQVVVAACDAWPAGWNLRRLRAAFGQVPCVVLSGSPLGGDFVVTQLQRGYFMQLPALPAQIMDLVCELSGD